MLMCLSGRLSNRLVRGSRRDQSSGYPSSSTRQPPRVFRSIGGLNISKINQGEPQVNIHKQRQLNTRP